MKIPSSHPITTNRYVLFNFYLPWSSVWCFSMMHTGVRLDSHWFDERLMTLKPAVSYLHGVYMLYTVAVFSDKIKSYIKQHRRDTTNCSDPTLQPRNIKTVLEH